MYITVVAQPWGSSRIRIMPLPSFFRKLSHEPLDPPLEASTSAQPAPPPSYEEATSDHGDQKDQKWPEDKLPQDLLKQAAQEAGTLLAAELQMLANYDTVIIVDDSTSMRLSAGHIPRGGRGLTRWQAVRNAISDVAAMACVHDLNGIDVEFLNAKESSKQHLTVLAAFDAITPEGITLLGARLDGLLTNYVRRLQGDPDRNHVKKVNFVVITDGEPSDRIDTVIIRHAKWLHAKGYPLGQVGIQFFQIGNDTKAEKFLHNLDNDLRGSPRDIVDTTPYEGAELTAARIIKVLAGGISRRIDNTVLESGE
ncbi:hypothetical protein BDW22DRAFT_468102 [Trametopsis cervina]|nr:hypothetical protein BDW22DRAFT_468102 [Trametopsis cervina]